MAVGQFAHGFSPAAEPRGDRPEGDSTIIVLRPDQTNQPGETVDPTSGALKIEADDGGVTAQYAGCGWGVRVGLFDFRGCVRSIRARHRRKREREGPSGSCCNTS
jgi:hypothetical protein